MKKRIIVVLLLVCVVLFAACQKDGEDNTAAAPAEKKEPAASFTSKEIADAVVAAFLPSDIPANTVLLYRYSGEDENSEDYLGPERVGLLITGRPEPVAEFGNFEDYAFYHPAGNSFFEVAVLRAKDGAAVDIGVIRDIFDRRLKRKTGGDIQNYVPEEIPLIENAKIVTAGSYAILLVTTDNKRAEDIISSMVYGDAGVSLENIASPPEETSEEATDRRPAAAFDGSVVEIESEILFDFEILSAIEGPSQTGEPAARRTSIPQVTAKHHSHNTSFLVGGKCEVGAMIRVTGGTEEIYTGSDNGDYLVEVPFSEEGTTILKMTAESPGKAPSEEITFVVKPRKDVTYYDDFGTFGVIVGYNFMSYFHDNIDFRESEALFTNPDREIASLTTRTAKKVSDLRGRNCNAEIIYLLVPSTTRIWPEDLPKRYGPELLDKTQTILDNWKKGVTDGGATVIDLTDTMLAHKNDEHKIWHKTDSHWTEYGAYLGYVELMNYIAQKFPDAAPRPSSDFEFYHHEMLIGDIYSRLNLESSDVRETSSYARFKFDPPHFNKDYNKGHLGLDLYTRGRLYIIHDRVSFEHTTNSDMPGNLPSIYVMRDSFEGPLHAFYTDRFSTATFQGMWGYGNFNVGAISRLDPDYVLYVISERNLKNVLYN